ncbi:AAA domain-containing protein [Aphelenchoides besseyi]|nr:AAA domain-containing protein [Aphelenchoides besseyi]
MATQLAPIFGGPAIRQPKAKVNSNVPWVEKYRPSKVEEVAYQTEVVSALKGCLNGLDLPHMLFYGPPGTGKTTSAVAICKQLFTDPDAYTERVLELNASDERGINVVRTRIKQFAQQMVRTTATKKCAATVKVVILDEADAMTSSAQMALRRIMETESRNTRFFLLCNYVSRIIAPLASRCVKFRFKPLPSDAQMERLNFVCKQEKLNITEEALDSLVKYSDGDLRKSITRLQSLSLGCKEIDWEQVAECCGQIGDIVIVDFVKACQEQRLTAMDGQVNEFLLAGYSTTQFLHQLAPHIVNETQLSNLQRAKILALIASGHPKAIKTTARAANTNKSEVESMDLDLQSPNRSNFGKHERWQILDQMDQDDYTDRPHRDFHDFIMLSIMGLLILTVIFAISHQLAVRAP